MTNTHRFFLTALCAALAIGGLANRAGAAVSDAVIKAQQERIDAIAKAKKSAVCVFARGGRGGGSGVVISPDGYALTNFHVVKPAGNHMKCSMADGELYDAVIVGIDPTGDVAIIKLLGRDDFPAAVIADSDEVQAGDWCFAIGNPFLLATDFQPTVTLGIVSGVHRYQYPAGTLLEYADCIQTDASINPGNSGGPLFNANGDLIGINGRGSFEKRGRVNVGVGYAISINQIQNFMGYLRSGRIVDHATLGATVATDVDGRVIVSNLLTTSDAYRRGLRYGDEIVSFGGRSIDTVNQFKNVLGIFPKGWRIPLTFRQEGELRNVHVRLTGVHAGDELFKKIQGPAAGPPAKPKDGEDPDNKKPMPMPHPGGGPAAAKTPPEIAKLIKTKFGYSNFYFNELNRDRVWSAFTASGDFSGLNGSWLLTGSMAGGEVQIAMEGERILAQFPDGPATMETKADLDTQLDPAGSGGLLVTLHLWRRLLMVGPQKFGDLHYVGTAPLLGREGVFDVYEATHNVLEARFSFDPKSGHLAGMEVYPDTNVDPCEVFFGDYRDVDGRQLPHTMEVRYGDELFGKMELKKIELPTSPSKES